MLNIGILGCGKISQVRHIPEYIANENANLVGLFDLDSQRCEEIAAKYGVKAYASAQELASPLSEKPLRPPWTAVSRPR